MSVRKAEKGNELYGYDLDRLVLREDGGAILVAEQYFVNVVTTYSGGSNGASTPVTTYYYNYNHLVIININPDGSIQWANKISKRQITSNDGGFYSSYTFSVVKDKMYFIFNDNPKNLQNKANDKLYNFALKGGVVVLVEMDKHGNMQKQALFNAREAEVITRPKVCEQVSANDVVIFGQKRRHTNLPNLLSYDFNKLLGTSSNLFTDK
jgi:hypothetical protein